MQSNMKMWLCTIPLMLLFIACPGEAQHTIAPASHWGGFMYPELEPAREVGVQFIIFTEFDNKCADPPMREPKRDQGNCDAEGGYKRYNDIDETVGFNLVTFGNTRYLRSMQTSWSNLLYRSVLSLGATNDRITSFLQNDIIHGGVIPGHEQADIPRGPNVSSGHPLIGYSGEFNLNFRPMAMRRNVLWFDPSPLFLGVGFSVGTIQNELFAHVGARDIKRKIWDDWLHVGVSFISRYGVFYNGPFDGATAGLRVFPNGDMASDYIINQGSVRFDLFPGYVPLSVELGITGSTGMFVEGKRDLLGHKIARHARKPIKEVFKSMKISIASVHGEVFNDSEGGKDRGPSYGFRLYLNVTTGSSRRLYDIFDRIGLRYL